MIPGVSATSMTAHGAEAPKHPRSPSTKNPRGKQDLQENHLIGVSRYLHTPSAKPGLEWDLPPTQVDTKTKTPLSSQGVKNCQERP